VLRGVLSWLRLDRDEKARSTLPDASVP